MKEMLKLNITLGSIIPKKTFIRGVPPSAGFARSAYSPKQVRKPTVGHTFAKASKPSWLFLVEKDTLLDEEISNWKRTE